MCSHRLPGGAPAETVSPPGCALSPGLSIPLTCTFWGSFAGVGYCALPGWAGGPLDVRLVFLIPVPLAAAGPQWRALVRTTLPGVTAAHRGCQEQRTRRAPLPPSVPRWHHLPGPCRLGVLGGEGTAGSKGDPAAVQPPDPLLFLLPASGAGGAVFTVRGPERTGRMGSGWRGERSGAVEGGSPTCPPKGITIPM